jgi:hypothetical protein
LNPGSTPVTTNGSVVGTSRKSDKTGIESSAKNSVGSAKEERRNFQEHSRKNKGVGLRM